MHVPILFIISLTVTVSFTQSDSENGIVVPDTPFCYHYNKQNCTNARTEDERREACTPRALPCVPTPGGSSSCVAVWSQPTINHTLPEHTDHSLERTMHLSCLPQGSKDTANCDYDCVSREQALVNTTSGRYVASCCCKGMFCNSLEGRSINITVKEYEGLDTATVTPANASQTATVFIVVGVVIGIVAILVVIVALCIIRRQHKLPPPVEDIQEMEEAEIQREAELHEANLSLRTEIAQGRYAKVYTGGEIGNTQVAIKCFVAAHRKMWHDEKEIYKRPGMKNHANITRFFGYLQQGSGNNSTMWIVIEYHPNGSIYDYLKGHILSWPDMLKLAHSMMKGLSYLHNEAILSDGHKLTMAHRDIKSKNILIKQNMTAAIADFGLAQAFTDGSVNESSVQFQAGTHRYMAPEVLDGAISFTKDAFLRIDVYAAALVLWELLSRCEVSGNTEYRAPYEEMESTRYHSLLEMLQVVVSKEKRRPSFPECLHRHNLVPGLITTIEETWDPDAEARLSAGCVESRLETLLATLNDNSTEVNNLRNLEPPPYSRMTDESAIPLIAYT